MRRPPPSDFVAHGARNRNGEHELMTMTVMKVVLMTMMIVTRTAAVTEMENTNCWMMAMTVMKVMLKVMVMVMLMVMVTLLLTAAVTEMGNTNCSMMMTMTVM